MSKPKLFVKHKDDIIIELTRRQDKRMADTAKNKIPRAVNHGWIQALKWTLDFDAFYNTKEDNLLLEFLAKQDDKEFVNKIDELTNKGDIDNDNNTNK